MPIHPLSVFPKGLELASRCPDCGWTNAFNLQEIVGILSPSGGVDSLKKLYQSEEPNKIEEFSINSTDKHDSRKKEATGMVGGDELCVHCEEKLDDPIDVPVDRASSVRCSACEKRTHFFPAPKWLKSKWPAITHILLPEEPTLITCPTCKISIPIGDHTPSDIKCEGCEGGIRIDSVPEKGVADDQFQARLELTSETVAQTIENVPWVIWSIVLLGGFLGTASILVRAGSSPDGSDINFGGFLLVVLILVLGLLVLPLTLHRRARLKRLLTELVEVERQKAELLASREDGPYR